MTKQCSVCLSKYEVKKSEYNNSFYCSRKCQIIGQSIKKKGKKPYIMTDAIRKRISEAKKGVHIWNGKRESMNWVVGEKNKLWKGDNVGYDALHDWINRHNGKAKTCIICGDNGGKKGCHWANLSGKYLRDLSDYVSLCPMHHKQIDMKGQKERVFLRE